MGESSADGDVHEEEPECCVSETGRGSLGVEPFCEEHGGDGHCSWFGDEGAEDRGDGEDGEPPCRGAAAEKFRDHADDAFGKPDDGAGGGDGHDDDDEERFGEINVFTEVEFDLFESRADAFDNAVFLNAEEVEDGANEGDDPDAEDCLYLAQEVKQVSAEGNIVLGIVVGFSAGCSSFGLDALEVALFVFMGHFEEESCEECVNDRADEYDGGNEVEAIQGECALLEGCSEIGISFRGELRFVAAERKGELCVLVFIELIFFFRESWFDGFSRLGGDTERKDEEGDED